MPTLGTCSSGTRCRGRPVGRSSASCCVTSAGASCRSSRVRVSERPAFGSASIRRWRPPPPRREAVSGPAPTLHRAVTRSRTASSCARVCTPGKYRLPRPARRRHRYCCPPRRRRASRTGGARFDPGSAVARRPAGHADDAEHQHTGEWLFLVLRVAPCQSGGQGPRPGGGITLPTQLGPHPPEQ